MESLKDLCVTKIHEITMDLLLKNDNLEIIPWKDRLDELPLSLKEDILEDAVTILVYPFKIRNIRYILRSSMGRYIRIMQMIMDRDQLDWFYIHFEFFYIFYNHFHEKIHPRKKKWFSFVSFFIFLLIFREIIVLLNTHTFFVEEVENSKSSVKMKSLKSICFAKIHEITARSLRGQEEIEIEDWKASLESLPQTLKLNLLQDAIEHMIIRLKIMNFRHLLCQNPMDRYIAVIETITNFERRPSVMYF